jgi:hypothetical protein
MKRLWVAIVCLCLTSVACFDPCGNDIKQELASPDGRYTATAFIRNCGATTDFSPQVYLRRKGSRMAKTGNVFRGYHTNGIEIRWLSASQLEISTPSTCEVITKQEEFEGIKISFRTLP